MFQNIRRVSSVLRRSLEGSQCALNTSVSGEISHFLAYRLRDGDSIQARRILMQLAVLIGYVGRVFCFELGIRTVSLSRFFLFFFDPSTPPWKTCPERLYNWKSFDTSILIQIFDLRTIDNPWKTSTKI